MNIALKDFEHIRQVYRQNPFVLIHPLLISAVVLILPLYAVLRYAAGNSALRSALLILAAGVLAYAARLVIIWRLNTYVITNQRIIHYAQRGLFDQTVTETPHERVLNVSYKTEGFISRVVGYGDVIVQVVGLMEPIILKNLSDPLPIKDYLWEMHKRISEDKSRAHSGAVFGETDATHVQEQVGYTKNNRL